MYRRGHAGRLRPARWLRSGRGRIHLLAARRMQSAAPVSPRSAPFGTATRSGCWPPEARCTSPFPASMRPAFSGFYLALMMVLWLLMLRGIVHRIPQPHREPVVAVRSGMPCSAAPAPCSPIFYGAALGNVVRGVPLNRDGYFFVPFWTNFRTGPKPGIIDWYTVLVGVAALLVLTMHGALWVAHKTDSDLEMRARGIARRLYWAGARAGSRHHRGEFRHPATPGGEFLGSPASCRVSAARRGRSAGRPAVRRRGLDLRQLSLLLRVHCRHALLCCIRALPLRAALLRRPAAGANGACCRRSVNTAFASAFSGGFRPSCWRLLTPPSFTGIFAAKYIWSRPRRRVRVEFGFTAMAKRILIADDQSAARELLTEVLSASGYEVLEAANGDDAICIALQSVPDLVLLDIQMPGRMV